MRFMPSYFFLSCSLLSGCGIADTIDGNHAVQCCYQIKWQDLDGIKSGSVCNDEPICPGNTDTTISNACDDICSEIEEIKAEEQLVPWPATWGTAPSGYVSLTVCSVDLESSHVAASAGGDEASDGNICSAASHPAGVELTWTGARSDVEFAENLGGRLTLGIAGVSEAPAYVGRAFYTLNDEQLILYSLTFETTSLLSFGPTTVMAAKGMLQTPVSATVDLATGAFSFAPPDRLQFAIVWEQDGEAFERSVAVSSDNATITGSLNLDGTPPSITLSGEVKGVSGGIAGKLTLDNVEGIIVNQPPIADPSRSDMLVDCAPAQHPDEVDEVAPVVLDARASWDPDDNLVSYVWQVDDTQLVAGAVSEVSLAPGTHDVLLIVRDGAGASATAAFAVQVGDREGNCN